MGPFTTILLLAFLTAQFCSCKVDTQDNAGSSNENLLAPEPQVDSSLWLKPSPGIRSILQDSKGNLWFGSTEWVCRYDGNTFTYFDEEGEPCGKGGTIQEDKNGTIWIQAGSKLCSFDGEGFSPYKLEQVEPSEQWEVAPNDLWFHRGLERSANWEEKPGAYRYHEGKFTYLNFPVPNGEDADFKYRLSCGPFIGNDGTIWFGTMEAVIGFKDGAFTILGREEMGRKDDPNQVGIRGLYEDSKGRLWIADNGSGLFVFEGDTIVNFTKLHHLGQGDQVGPTLHRAFSISEDKDGNMWFGTVYSGIWRFDGTTLSNYGEKEGVVSENIWTIYKTPKGELLFAGERPGAVYQFNGQSFDRVF